MEWKTVLVGFLRLPTVISELKNVVVLMPIQTVVTAQNMPPRERERGRNESEFEGNSF